MPDQTLTTLASILLSHMEAYDKENPPHRPNKVFTTLRDEKDKIIFLTDLENECLREYAGNCPKGCSRYKFSDWAEHLKKNLYPFHSDADWYEYIQFCEDGHGDEWFFDEEE